MTEFGQKLRATIEEARRLHAREREVVSESILTIRTLAWMRAEHFIAGKHEALAKQIGLTSDQYFKRLRVAKLSWYFPQEAMINRLTEVLSARGQVPSTTEAILTAVDKLLSQRDQVRRAAKMADKDAAREGTLRDEAETDGEGSTAARQSGETVLRLEPDLLPRGSDPKTRDIQKRRSLPAAVRRAVYRQSRGVCQHRMPDGHPCGATRMLEIDHVVPLTRGGRDDLSNLTLVCREHNHHRARRILGAETMDRYRPLGPQTTKIG